MKRADPTLSYAYMKLRRPTSIVQVGLDIKRNSDWHKFRKSLRGVPLDRRLEMLTEYRYSHDAVHVVSNYINALSRAGLIGHEKVTVNISPNTFFHDDLEYHIIAQTALDGTFTLNNIYIDDSRISFYIKHQEYTLWRKTSLRDLNE